MNWPTSQNQNKCSLIYYYNYKKNIYIFVFEGAIQGLRNPGVGPTWPRVLPWRVSTFHKKCYVTLERSQRVCTHPGLYGLLTFTTIFLSTEGEPNSSSSSKVVDYHIDQNLQQEMSLPKPERKQKHTAATKKWKENMKANDPEKYEAFREKRRGHMKEKRKNMSDEQRAKQREQSRLRMNAKRERDRLSKQVEEPPKTFAVQEEQRNGWKEGKQTYRANMSAQKKRRVNERRRNSYHQKKAVPRALSAMLNTPRRYFHTVFEHFNVIAL